MDSTEIVAQLMAVAAVTAPKTKGENFVQVKILQGEPVQQLARAMAELRGRIPEKGFRSGRAERSEFRGCGTDRLEGRYHLRIELRGMRIQPVRRGGLVGQAPVDVEFHGPVCAYRLLDMGIALGSAVKVARPLPQYR